MGQTPKSYSIAPSGRRKIPASRVETKLSENIRIVPLSRLQKIVDTCKRLSQLPPPKAIQDGKYKVSKLQIEILADCDAKGTISYAYDLTYRSGGIARSITLTQQQAGIRIARGYA